MNIIMKILFVANYLPWYKVAEKKMPSHHLFGIHEMVEHYEMSRGKLRGILKGGGMLISSLSPNSTFCREK